MGLAAPELAQVISPWIGEFVAVLLFVSGIRVGARQAFGSLHDLSPTLTRIAFFQCILPLFVIVMLYSFGVLEVPLALAVCLMLAAPSVTGAPNFAIMIGQDPGASMRLLVLGTALFPVTALPVLVVFDPTGGGAVEAVSLSLKLMVAILISVSLGFGVRWLWPRFSKPDAQSALDGCAALVLSVVVIGLMSAVGPLLRSDPLQLALWILVAITINLTLVIVTFRAHQRVDWAMGVATAIYAGNRNIALFLIVLPAEVAAPLMIFVGCYQIPMYLTPVLMARLTRMRPG